MGPLTPQVVLAGQARVQMEQQTEVMAETPKSGMRLPFLARADQASS
jgi:hypothetical protein